MLTFFYNGILSPCEPFSHAQPYIFTPNTRKRVRTDFMSGRKIPFVMFLGLNVMGNKKKLGEIFRKFPLISLVLLYISLT